MRVAICEDLPRDAGKLHTLLLEYCEKEQLDIHIDSFADGYSLLEAYLPGKYQILFLDVLMDGINGMKVAEKIRDTDLDVAIILITVSREFAVDSYLINAAFYIVKPVDHVSLEHAMAHCQHLIMQHAKSIEVIQNRKAVKVRLRDILYLESQRNDCVLYSCGGDIRTRAQISSLEMQLGGVPFLRCHHSFIVNLRWVEDITGRDFILRDGLKIPISRAYASAVQREFNQYLISGARRIDNNVCIAYKE